MDCTRATLLSFFARYARLKRDQKMILLSQGNVKFSVDIFRRCLRLRAGLACVMALQVLAAMAVRADDSALEAHPPSKWVLPRSFDKPKADDPVDSSLDYRWLLSDRQINAQNDEEFVHQARQILTPAGAQFGAHVMINYDPTCQSLTFHWARLWRGANKLGLPGPRPKCSSARSDLTRKDFFSAPGKQPSYRWTTCGWATSSITLTPS